MLISVLRSSKRGPNIAKFKLSKWELVSKSNGLLNLMTNLNLLRYLRNLDLKNFLTSLDFFGANQPKSNWTPEFTLIYYVSDELKISAHFFLLNSYLSIFVSAEKSQIKTTISTDNNRKIWILKRNLVKSWCAKKSKNSAKGEEKTKSVQCEKNYVRSLA